MDCTAGCDVTPSSFSFSDGQQTVSTFFEGDIFEFFTNASDAITGWHLKLFVNLSGTNAIITSNVASEGFLYDLGFQGLFSGNYQEGYNDDPGQFALVSATPLPAALPLFITDLGAMGLLGWRRKDVYKRQASGCAGAAA